jgi:hypothetical protein
VQPGGGAAEMKLLRNGDEISQLAQFHGRLCDSEYKSVLPDSILDTIKPRA